MTFLLLSFFMDVLSCLNYKCIFVVVVVVVVVVQLQSAHVHL